MTRAVVNTQNVTEEYKAFLAHTAKRIKELRRERGLTARTWSSFMAITIPLGDAWNVKEWEPCSHCFALQRRPECLLRRSPLKIPPRSLTIQPNGSSLYVIEYKRFTSDNGDYVHRICSGSLEMSWSGPIRNVRVLGWHGVQ